MVLLAGEAGIGKSRLVRALRDELRGKQPFALLSHHCSPHHGGSALHPVIAALRRAAGLAPEDPPERQLAKLEAALALPPDRLRGGALLLADLLGIPGVDRSASPGATPQRRKKLTFQVLLDHLAALAARAPVLAVCEVAHWADPTTLELLTEDQLGMLSNSRRRSLGER